MIVAAGLMGRPVAVDNAVMSRVSKLVIVVFVITSTLVSVALMIYSLLVHPGLHIFRL
jgi:hypothetical protein